VIILCTHHKGGVGKTELAIHVAGVLQKGVDRILLLDCDSQASAWEFYFRGSPTVEKTPRAVDATLSVMWNPSRTGLRTLTETGEFGHIVIDVDSPLQNTVQAIIQDRPNLILIPISLPHEHEGLVRLGDPLTILGSLGKTAQLTSRVRIVPLGSRLSTIQARLAELGIDLPDCKAAPRLRNLQKETQRARKERRYVWEYPGCEDVADYFSSLVEG
jgi:chromosome partitioning protein